MFQNLVALLTAATFVAHGLLGCCWHHTHSHAAHAQDAVAESGGCHGHGQAHSSTLDPATQHDDRQDRDSGAPRDSECGEEHCVFVRTQDGVSSGEDVSFAVAEFLEAAFSLDGSGCTVAGAPEAAAVGTAPPLSAPLHALRQVWLI